MRGLRQIFAAIVAASISVACSDGPLSDGPASADLAANEPSAHLASISGTISYRERTALTNTAEAVVTLDDATRQDFPAVRLAQQTISDPGQVPVRFVLDFPRTAIDPRGRYVLRAQITDRGQLLFATDTRTPVLTRGAGNEVHLLLVPIDRTSPEPVALAAVEPVTAGTGVPLRGMFRYMADAARFRDSRTNRHFPVAMEGAYKEVEYAYFNSGIKPGSELMIEVVGRYLGRQVMEENHSELNLMNDSFKNLPPEKACIPQAPHP